MKENKVVNILNLKVKEQKEIIERQFQEYEEWLDNEVDQEVANKIREELGYIEDRDRGDYVDLNYTDHLQHSQNFIRENNLEEYNLEDIFIDAHYRKDLSCIKDEVIFKFEKLGSEGWEDQEDIIYNDVILSLGWCVTKKSYNLVKEFLGEVLSNIVENQKSLSSELNNVVKRSDQHDRNVLLQIIELFKEKNTIYVNLCKLAIEKLSFYSEKDTDNFKEYYGINNIINELSIISDAVDKQLKKEKDNAKKSLYEDFKRDLSSNIVDLSFYEGVEILDNSFDVDRETLGDKINDFWVDAKNYISEELDKFIREEKIFYDNKLYTECQNLLEKVGASDNYYASNMEYLMRFKEDIEFIFSLANAENPQNGLPEIFSYINVAGKIAPNLESEDRDVIILRNNNLIEDSKYQEVFKKLCDKLCLLQKNIYKKPLNYTHESFQDKGKDSIIEEYNLRFFKICRILIERFYHESSSDEVKNTIENYIKKTVKNVRSLLTSNKEIDFRKSLLRQILTTLNRMESQDPRVVKFSTKIYNEILKSLPKKHFEEYKEELEEYLKNKKEILIGLNNIGEYVSFKLPNNIRFIVPKSSVKNLHEEIQDCQREEEYINILSDIISADDHIAQFNICSINECSGFMQEEYYLSLYNDLLEDKRYTENFVLFASITLRLVDVSRKDEKFDEALEYIEKIEEWIKHLGNEAKMVHGDLIEDVKIMSIKVNCYDILNKDIDNVNKIPLYHNLRQIADSLSTPNNYKSNIYISKIANRMWGNERNFYRKEVIKYYEGQLRQGNDEKICAQILKEYYDLYLESDIEKDKDILDKISEYSETIDREIFRRLNDKALKNYLRDYSEIWLDIDDKALEILRKTLKIVNDEDALKSVVNKIEEFLESTNKDINMDILKVEIVNKKKELGVEGESVVPLVTEVSSQIKKSVQLY